MSICETDGNATEHFITPSKRATRALHGGQVDLIISNLMDVDDHWRVEELVVGQLRSTARSSWILFQKVNLWESKICFGRVPHLRHGCRARYLLSKKNPCTPALRKMRLSDHSNRVDGWEIKMTSVSRTNLNAWEGGSKYNEARSLFARKRKQVIWRRDGKNWVFHIWF